MYILRRRQPAASWRSCPTTRTRRVLFMPLVQAWCMQVAERDGICRAEVSMVLIGTVAAVKVLQTGKKRPAEWGHAACLKMGGRGDVTRAGGGSVAWGPPAAGGPGAATAGQRGRATLSCDAVPGLPGHARPPQTPAHCRRRRPPALPGRLCVSPMKCAHFQITSLLQYLCAAIISAQCANLIWHSIEV